MARRVVFLALAAFWVTMNVLLWRAEFRPDAEGDLLPPAIVWRRMLTAPDDSGLAINMGQNRIGFVRWIPNAGQEMETGKVGSENEIEGRVTVLTNYTVNCEGNFLMPESNARLRFELNARFDQAQKWRDWDLTITQRPNQWRISADKEKDLLELRVGPGKEPFTQRIKLSDLQNPQKLLNDTGLAAALPMAAGLIPGLDPAMLSEIPTNAAPVSAGIQWTARQDWMKIGNSRIRVYRLEAQLLEDYKAVMLLTRVGEILRIELPGEVVLANESLINL